MHETTPSAVSGPPRMEYEVTNEGEQEYFTLLSTAPWGPIGEVIGLWLQTAESRAQWTRRLIRRLEKGAFRMAGKD